MDAYDIFKKLTVGLKFKNKPATGKNINGKNTTLPAVKKEEDVAIKDEALSEEELDENISEGSHSGSEQSDGELQLVDGVTVGKKKKKKKKEKTEDLKKKLELEEQNHFRNTYGIRVVGRHIPAALKDLSELKSRYNVSETLINTIRQCGYEEPTPIQRQAWPCMMEDRQILACAPTGSGKTAGFLVPLIHALGGAGGGGGPRALVLCPTRELAQQTRDEALRLTAGTDLRCSVLRKLQETKVKERAATFRKSDIVITTPNRLCYLLDQDGVNINLDKVRWLVLDEADKLFEGSELQAADFRQQIERVLTACGGRERRVALFSATHTPAAARWARRQLRGLLAVTVGQRNAASSLVQQELTFCGSEAGKLLAFRQLLQAGVTPPVLVFVQSKERAKQLFKELLYDGVSVDVIHADRTQQQRENVIRAFRSGRVWVLLCTELLARGLDFRAVGLVVNYDFPPSAIAYVHRVGRAGRAGQPGRAVTFFTQDDVANLRSIAAVVQQSGGEVPAYMLRLQQDRGARRRLRDRAPRRDHISTILGKRKPDEAPGATGSADTDKVRNSKSKKQRKVDTNKNRLKTPPQGKSGGKSRGKGGDKKKSISKNNKKQMPKKVKKI